MATKKITALSELAYASMAVTDCAAVEQADGTTWKCELRDLKQFFLDNKTVGGSGAGDIANIDSAQTLTNKTMTMPVFNGGAALTTTSTELNLLDGLTADYTEINKLDGLATSKTELGYVAGVTSPIQTQINALNAVVESATTKTYAYQYGFTLGVGVTTLNRTQAQILVDMGIPPASYVIDHRYITAQLWIVQAGTYTNVVLESGGANVVFTKQTVSGQDQLNTLSLSGMTEQKEYNLVITFKIAEKAGS